VVFLAERCEGLSICSNFPPACQGRDRLTTACPEIKVGALAIYGGRCMPPAQPRYKRAPTRALEQNPSLRPEPPGNKPPFRPQRGTGWPFPNCRTEIKRPFRAILVSHKQNAGWGPEPVLFQGPAAGWGRLPTKHSPKTNASRVHVSLTEGKPTWPIAPSVPGKS